MFNQASVNQDTIRRLVNLSIVNIEKPVALEIGTFQGQTAGVIGQILKPLGGKVYVVDWWLSNYWLEEADREIQGWNKAGPQGEYVNERFMCFDKNMRDLKLENVVLPLKMSSDDAYPILKDLSFDFVFIDAAHYYSQVTRDIFNFFPKVKVGGVFCGHDCETRLENLDVNIVNKYCEKDGVPGDSCHFGVIKAVGEAFKQYDLENDIWYFVKKSADYDVHINSNIKDIVAKTKSVLEVMA